MKLKRNNFSNKEIIDIIRSFRTHEKCFGKGVPKEVVDNTIAYTNQAVDQIAELFLDYSRDPEDYSALAYDTDDKITYHVGTILPQ